LTRVRRPAGQRPGAPSCRPHHATTGAGSPPSADAGRAGRECVHARRRRRGQLAGWAGAARDPVPAGVRRLHLHRGSTAGQAVLERRRSLARSMTASTRQGDHRCPGPGPASHQSTMGSLTCSDRCATPAVSAPPRPPKGQKRRSQRPAGYARLRLDAARTCSASRSGSRSWSSTCTESILERGFAIHTKMPLIGLIRRTRAMASSPSTTRAMPSCQLPWNRTRTLGLASMFLTKADARPSPATSQNEPSNTRPPTGTRRNCPVRCPRVSMMPQPGSRPIRGACSLLLARWYARTIPRGAARSNIATARKYTAPSRKAVRTRPTPRACRQSQRPCYPPNVRR